MASELDVGSWPFSDITQRPKHGGFRTEAEAPAISPAL